MKRILLSIGSILFAGAMLVGGTGAFGSQMQTSTGNTFATGVIDLKIDNESYVTDDTGKLVFSPSTSWSLSNLAGKLFFNFLDLKPGDIGEDTISFHVNNNNAWACMSIKLTKTPENGITEPESFVDSTPGENQGELQKVLKFVFWADDGDNVFERGEILFKYGYAKDIFNGTWWTLADSKFNIWNQKKNSPIPGSSVKYIGKAWCFGNMGQNPVPQDGKGKKEGSVNGPLVRGTGFTCDGADLGNLYQSDGIKVDVSFLAMQSRDNTNFTCSK